VYENITLFPGAELRVADIHATGFYCNLQIRVNHW